MNTSIRRIMLGLWFCALALTLGVHGTTASEPRRWGVHVQIYGEPHEDGNPVYVNVLPLTYERPLTGHMTVKTGAIVSLRFADGVTLGNLGFKAGLPLYSTEIANGRMEGFFAGPLVQLSRNVHTRERVVSAALDLGYSFYPADWLSMTVGGEAGFSTFFLDGEIAFRPHFGPGVYLYF